MITRKSLSVLSALTIVLFICAALTAHQHHGAGSVIGFLCWWGFLVAALVLVGSAIATLLHHRTNTRQPSQR